MPIGTYTSSSTLCADMPLSQSCIASFRAHRYSRSEAEEYAGGGFPGMFGHERFISMASGMEMDGCAVQIRR